MNFFPVEIGLKSLLNFLLFAYASRNLILSRNYNSADCYFIIALSTNILLQKFLHATFYLLVKLYIIPENANFSYIFDRFRFLNKYMWIFS